MEEPERTTLTVVVATTSTSTIRTAPGESSANAATIVSPRVAIFAPKTYGTMLSRRTTPRATSGTSTVSATETDIVTSATAAPRPEHRPAPFEHRCTAGAKGVGVDARERCIDQPEREQQHADPEGEHKEGRKVVRGLDDVS